jgi:hypothetical protein
MASATDVFAAAPASMINLSPPAQAFVDNKVTSLGTWVRYSSTGPSVK